VRLARNDAEGRGEGELRKMRKEGSRAMDKEKTEFGLTLQQG